MAPPTIDAHQHFWDPDAGEFGWLSGPFAPLRRTFAPVDLAPALNENGVAATVLVQVQHTLRETRDFLALAERTPFVAGVVGWVDLTDPAVADTLAELKEGPHGRWLVGVRHLVQDEPDPEWLLRGDVRRGLRAVAKAGLVYDLLGRTVHLPAMLRTVAEVPEGRFVLDHIAKPEIAAGVREPWASLMRGFAPHRDRVWCKLSGMITEADWSRWTAADLRPYVEEALAIFGPDRCMFGSDWPVCLVAGSYGQVIGALRDTLGRLSDAERRQIFGRSAVQAYRLPGFV